MPQFHTAPEIFTSFPGLRIAVVVTHDLDNTRARPAIAALWQAAWQHAGAEGLRYGNAQTHPKIAPWRERFKAMGVSPKEFPTSIEAMVPRASKGGEPFIINPAVDLYNAISLQNIVPAGAFDLATLPDDLEARLSRNGDSFWGLDVAEPVAVSAGETCYASDSTVVTRHFLWRRSRAGLVTTATRSAIFVAEVIVPDTALTQKVLGDLRDGLYHYLGCTTISGIIDQATPMFRW